jgi:cytochrome oxidase assembly protein ShyY1
VIGRVRLPETTGGAGFDADSGSARAVDLADLEDVLPGPLAPVWVELTSQQPAADPALAVVPPPRLSTGPSLVYAVQWWIFAVTAVIGTVVLLRRAGQELLEAPLPTPPTAR